MNIIQATNITQRIFQTNTKVGRIPIAWVGGSGLGKTTQARLLAEELNLPLVYVSVRTDDALGINLVQKGRLVFTPHSDIAQILNTPSLIYIDELNRADRYARAQVMELLGERTLGGVAIHPDCRLLVTVNPETSDYEVNELDQALKTRVVALPIHFDLQVSTEYAELHSLTAMAAFINACPDLMNEKLEWHIPKPDPRLLEYLALVTNEIGYDAREIVEFALKENACHFPTDVVQRINNSIALESPLLREVTWI